MALSSPKLILVLKSHWLIPWDKNEATCPCHILTMAYRISCLHSNCCLTSDKHTCSVGGGRKCSHICECGSQNTKIDLKSLRVLSALSIPLLFPFFLLLFHLGHTQCLGLTPKCLLRDWRTRWVAGNCCMQGKPITCCTITSASPFSLMRTWKCSSHLHLYPQESLN